MNGLILIAISVVVLALAYLLYGRFLARTWGIDPSKKTPAYEFEDGKDYVPTSPSVVFGNQFASIAGAGPINGPIIAAMFGWLPVFLWLLLGSVFFGAVHDFATMYASVKNKGKSIGYLIELYVGKTGKRLFLLFMWCFSILITAAFADIVSGTFAGFNSNGDRISANASVASASCLFIAAAIGLGWLIRRIRVSGLASGIIAIDLLIVCIVAGIFFPIYLPGSSWLYLVFGYIYIASVVPIWVLGQPRNYLNSFLLIAMIIAAFIGVAFTAPEITIPAFTGFKINENYLFPSLFITIACGAISGFHSMVSTGETSRQISNEKYILPVSYGSMLIETLLAVLALISVGSLAVNGKLPSGPPPVIFATAVSGFLHQIGLPENISYTIVSLAISAFVLTTLDAVTRLGRIAFQELFMQEEGEKKLFIQNFLSKTYVASACTIASAYFLSINGYQKIWPIFGASNQLLAVLSLVACAVFIKHTRRRGFMLVIPITIMMAITFTSLILSIKTKIMMLLNNTFDMAIDGFQFIILILLLILGLIVFISCGVKLLKKIPDSIAINESANIT
ncbi:MAG: carbon starvation protein A [Leptospirales bacterium]|nr:carbon starvation protein A [Leptospirales bacterium]